jgi:hypothetical protein
MLSKWIVSPNATLQLAAMKMICDPEEHKKLQQNYTDVSFDDKKQISSLFPTQEEFDKAFENSENGKTD